MTYLMRLVILYVAVIGVVVGGYWSVSNDLEQSVSDMWAAGVDFFEHFDRQLVFKAVVVWVVAVGWRFFLIEVPKRLAIYFLVPYLIIWLLPKRWHKSIRRWFRKTRQQLMQTKARLMNWLRLNMFGPHTRHALGLLIAMICILLFYSLFWTYLIVWFGFVKIPAFIAGFFRYIGRWILFALGKIPYAKVVFEWGPRISEWVDDQIPQVRWTLTPEEKRRRAKKRARKAILLRYKREHMFEKISLSTYRKLLPRKGRSTTTSSVPPTEGRGSTKGEAE